MKVRKMKKTKTKRKLNNKGFSLIELIIVIAILAILTAIIAPNFIKYMKKAQKVRDAKTAEVMGSTLERILALNPDAVAEWDTVTGNYGSHVEYTVPKDDGTSYYFSNVFEYCMTKKGDIVPNPNHPEWHAEKNYTNGIIRDATKRMTKTTQYMEEELGSDYYTVSYRYHDIRIFRVGKNLETGGVEVWACVIPKESSDETGVGLTDGQGTTNGRITYKLYPETDPDYYTDWDEPTKSITGHKYAIK